MASLLVWASLSLTLAADGGVAAVKARVVDVVSLDDGSAAVLLGTADSDAVLPIFIGAAEALAIRLRLEEAAPPRPLTHDLLEDTLEALGARVLRVEIDDLKAETFLGRVSLRRKDGSVVVLDARPSDSIALAVGARAPILVAPAVWNRARVPPPRLRGPRRDPPRTESL